MEAIALIVPFVRSWFYSEVAEGAALSIRAAGLETRLNVLGPDAEGVADEVVSMLERPEIAGAIVVDFDITEPEAARLVATGKALARIGGLVPLLPTVMIDDSAAAQMATQHLIAAGHKAITHVGGALADQADLLVHSRRLKGYMSAMTAAGLESYARFEPCGDTMEEGRLAASRVLADPPQRPTAIFAVSDELAFGAAVVATRLGMQVPRDVSLVGFGDHQLSNAYGLTTIRQNPRGMAETAVEMVLQQRGGLALAALAGPHLQEHTLISRSTVGPPRG